MFVMLIISGRVRLSKKPHMIRVEVGYGPEGARNKKNLHPYYLAERKIKGVG